MTTVDLRRLGLRPGEELRDEHEVEIAPLELGGQRYVAVPELVPAELTVTRAANGTVFHLRLTAQLHGPCYRCLEDAALDQPIDAREYQAEDPLGDEELQSAYVAGDKLDLSGWGRDSVVLALPDKILCRPDCAGLCPVCGKNLNREPHGHEGEEIDPRWAGLAELRDSLQ
jgi:DUF177 domain-containing protein